MRLVHTHMAPIPCLYNVTSRSRIAPRGPKNRTCSHVEGLDGMVEEDVESI